MMRNSKHESESDKPWRAILEDLLDASVEVVRNGVESSPRWDDLLDSGQHRFAIQHRRRSDAASVSVALQQISSLMEASSDKLHPLLVVDHMGKTGGELARRVGVDWIDLAGNASITHVPRMRIVVEGKKPVSLRRGRKQNVFAAKSSRVGHWFLLNQNRAHRHHEIVEATGIDKGQLSRILSRMEELRLIRRDEDRYTLAKPSVMIEAWREAFEPPCRRILKGVIPSRSGGETVQILEATFCTSMTRHAIGGLSAAWLWDAFADFRLVTCYLQGHLDDNLLGSIGFVESDRGANVWLMEDADEVVFLGSERRQQVSVTSPWFTYVDLAVHPERSSEAAEHLREHVLRMEVAR